MAFCSFSKEYDENAYTLIENKFITKYLPNADGFAVKVYLYGLYLCKRAENEFDLKAMATALNTTEKKIADAFLYWEDYDLVDVVSRDPLSIAYLPVRSALGRLKKIRYEQYADFNKELQRKFQKVGKFVTAADYVKYMNFLEENDIQPQAFLLIAEFCINKQGENVSPSYIFNKAKKFIRNGWTSYEQVERELSNYNAHEGDLTAIFALIGVSRAPDESDYALYKKWTEEQGFAKAAIMTAARKMKRGSVNSLDLLLSELAEKGKLEAKEIETYLTERETLGNLTFRIAKKLGLKISNPATYVDEYVEKWFTFGYEDSSLLDIALYCLKTDRGDFGAMHALVQTMFSNGIVSKDSVKEYLKGKNDELKLFTAIQGICGGIRKSVANLELIRTWRDWKFSNEMILEAAKRAATSANPIPYMNKILSDWKHSNIFRVEDLATDTKPTGNTGANAPTGSYGGYTNPNIEAINAKSDRERYYALKRQEAQKTADKNLAKANENARFKEISVQLSKMEISLAKAEVFAPETLPSLQDQKSALLAERAEILRGMGMTEAQLTPQYSCPKCSDTGFLKNGKACDCYKLAQGL
ncbi:MAG: DnaD domain protein [Clostridia bacterium]|nr:DnaD domain protein [Clostridia bacterium]